MKQCGYNNTIASRVDCYVWTEALLLKALFGRQIIGRLLVDRRDLTRRGDLGAKMLI